MARRQQALSWELRAAISLARLWSQRGRRREAVQLLAEVDGRFGEGDGTGDRVTARELLAELAG